MPISSYLKITLDILGITISNCMTLPRVQLFFFRWKQSVFPMSLICKPLRNKQQPKKTTLLSLWPHFALGVEFDLILRARKVACICWEEGELTQNNSTTHLDKLLKLHRITPLLISKHVLIIVCRL